MRIGQKEQWRQASRRYYYSHLAERREAARMYRKNNPEKRRETDRKNCLKTRKIRSERERRAHHVRKLNPGYRIKKNLRTRMWAVLKGRIKVSGLKDVLGCSIEQLKSYLASQFTSGMSWENYGKWHVDHIKPCSAFDLSNEAEQKRCFHFTNLQPLWSQDNLRKYTKVCV